MKRITLITILAASIVLLAHFRDGIQAQQAPCTIVSAGAETDGVTASLLNVGQAAIGRANNGALFMQAGGLGGCGALRVFCLLGDVNGDGFKNGLDVQPYVDVLLTGMGTPRELCAADVGIPGFVDLILIK